MKLTKLTILLHLLVLVCACDEPGKDPKLNFVGDSIVARWPLSETFPTQYVKNYGVSGSGIAYIESLKNRFNGETVIFQIGTNDNFFFSPEKVNDYVDRYIDALNSTGATMIYLYSVLPRDFNKDRETINLHIRQFNELVASNIKSYHHIRYIDVYNLFLYDGHINYQYYSDGLHLNIYGYEVLSKALLDNLNNIHHEN